MKKKSIISIILSLGICASFVPQSFAETPENVAWDFVYEENFSDGVVPEGWTTYSHASSSKPTASIVDGKLQLAVTSWEAGGIKLTDLGQVLRAGLTMEADITVVKANKSSGGKEWAGLSYMITDTTESSVRMSTKDDYASIAEGKYTIWNPAADTFISTSSLKMLEKFVTNKETVQFKAVFGEDGSPVFYLDGNDVGVVAGTYDSGIDEGFVGFNAAYATILIDNVKITGKKMMPVEEAVTVSADFTTEDTLFETEADAIAAVKVTKNSYTNGVEDITESCEITTALDGARCTVTVTYNGEVVDTLACIVATDIEWAFVYEEDFSSGVVPSEWIATDTTVSMSVSDEALILKNEEEWHGDYVLFTDLGNVLRQGLTMEFDITRIGDPKSGNSNNSGAGFAYMANLTDGTSTGSYCTLYTDKPLAYQQGDVMDPYRASFNYQNPTGGIMNEGGTHHLKLVFNNTTQSPVIYLDGAQPDGYGRTWSDKMVTSGLVGLFCYNTTVKIDNIKITGKKRVPVTEAVTVSADFTTDTPVFESVDAAIAAVKVTKNSYLDGVEDVTNDAEITAATVASDCKVTVKYDGKVVDVLDCELSGLEIKDFVYEESFDTGVVPAGWVTYTHSDGATTASVVDGKLQLAVTSWSAGGIKLTDLGKVLRSGLTMEADITFVKDNSGSSGKEWAGMSYMITDTTESSVRMSTKDDYASIAEGMYTIWNPAANTFISTSSLGMFEKFVTNKETVKFKAVFGEDGSPVFYLDGNNIGVAAGTYDSGIDEGFVGFNAASATILIDNVKITGKKAVKETNPASITVKSNAFNDSKLSLAVEAMNKNADITDALMVATVYEKGTNKLVAMSALKDWDAEAIDIINTALEVVGVSDYSSELYDVKVMAMDKTTLTPVAENAEF